MKIGEEKSTGGNLFKEGVGGKEQIFGWSGEPHAPAGKILMWVQYYYSCTYSHTLTVGMQQK